MSPVLSILSILLFISSSLALGFPSLPCSQQMDENMIPSFILLHRPSVEVDFGKLHHAGSLYHRKTNYKNAIESHNNMINTIKQMGVQYGVVEDILHRNESRLREVADKVYKFHYSNNKNNNNNNHEEEDAAIREYKLSILNHLPPSELFEIALLRPQVHLTPDSINTHITTTHTQVSPLTNLVFTRDQSITTNKGVVLAALNSPQRQFETTLLKHVWDELGVNLVGIIQPPGKAEGGDFIAVSSEISMIGQGLRTNSYAIQQMLDGDMFGTRRVVVVVDRTDLNQERMHLDTFFNMIKNGYAVIEENVLNEVGNFTRYVEEYTRNASGKYELTKQTTFIKYLKEDMGWKLIPVTYEDQANYMINFLLMGEKDGRKRIISTNPGLKKLFEESEYKEELKDVDVTYVEYDGLTAMYGAAHCTTQVFRCPPSDAQKGLLLEDELY